MTYIVIALKAEAQAFVEYFKLTQKKQSLNNYTFYETDDFRLIVSGIGIENARLATQTLINYFDITEEDRYCNIGVCGASKEYAIGEVIVCGGVQHEGRSYVFDPNAPLVTCVDHAVAKEGSATIVDMESYGFYDAVVHNPAIQNFSIIKVVSDHFEPKSLSKDGVKILILKQIDKIMLPLQSINAIVTSS